MTLTRGAEEELRLLRFLVELDLVDPALRLRFNAAFWVAVPK